MINITSMLNCHWNLSERLQKALVPTRSQTTKIFPTFPHGEELLISWHTEDLSVFAASDEKEILLVKEALHVYYILLIKIPLIAE